MTSLLFHSCDETVETVLELVVNSDGQLFIELSDQSDESGFNFHFITLDLKTAKKLKHELQKQISIMIDWEVNNG